MPGWDRPRRQDHADEPATGEPQIEKSETGPYDQARHWDLSADRSEDDLARWELPPPPLDGKAPPSAVGPPLLVVDADGRLRPGPGWDTLPDTGPRGYGWSDKGAEATDRPEEAARVAVEGVDNTPLDPRETRPRIEWRDGDPPIDPGDLRSRDAVVYVRPERRDDRNPDSGLGGPNSGPRPGLSPEEHAVRINQMRGQAADVMGASRWSNSKYAGAAYDKLPASLQERFPHGVQFSDEGFPMFDRYAVKTVVFEEGFRGPDRRDDFKRANSIFGWKDEPDGYVWHHKEDNKTMLLMDEDLHGVRHWGGVRASKQLEFWEGRDKDK